MNEILKQYRKVYRVAVIGNWSVTALCAAALACMGTFEKRPFNACIIVGALALLALFYTAEFVIEPLIFKRKITKAGGDLLDSLKEKPASFTTRFFFKNTAVFFANWKIKYMDCREITAAELLRRKIRLTLRDGRILNMPFKVSENPAVLCAVLRSLNGDIDFVINGKHINKATNKKPNKSNQSEDKL